MSEIEILTKQKDYAYWERNQLVAALSKVFPSFLVKHPEEDKDWEDDWRTIVVIQLPTESCVFPHRDYEVVHTEIGERDRIIGDGEAMQSSEKFSYLQLTWHIHDSEVSMFDHLRYRDYPNRLRMGARNFEYEQAGFQWDGHTNEEKYRRLRLLAPIKQQGV